MRDCRGQNILIFHSVLDLIYLCAPRRRLLRDQILVKNGMANRVTDLGRRAIANTSWDDAVINLDNTFDLEWAKANIGRYFAETEGFEAAMVLDRDDRPIYGMRGDKTVDVGTMTDLEKAAVPLVGLVREAELKRGPIGPILANDNKMSAPIVFSAVSRAGAELFVLTAILVQPDFGKAIPATDRSAVVITGDLFDADFINAFADRFLLANVTLANGIAVPKPGRAQLLLRDSQDNIVATLQWAPPALGTALLRKSLPTTLLLFMCLGAIGWRLFQKGHRAAQALVESEARAFDLASHKSQFLANMSHEIRTPLNGVLGMAQSLNSDALSLAQRQKVAIILDTGNTLMAVLNDVLDLSKIEAGKLEISPVDDDILKTLESIRWLFQSQAAAKMPDKTELLQTKILLTDDNAINRQIVRLLLAPLGVNIAEAENGRVALEKLAAEPFDLVLLDIHMPVMDGCRTIEAIRRSEASWRTIPVMALTADATNGARERYLALGMDDTCRSRWISGSCMQKSSL